MARSTTVLPPVTHGPIRLVPARWEAFLEGRPVALTPTEFSILYLLASTPDAALTYEQLRRTCMVRGKDPRAITAHVYALRRKLGRHGGLVAKVFGVGYKIAELEAKPPRQRVPRRR